MGSFSTVGGVGITKLSELIIDVDKDWSGKNITNVFIKGIDVAAHAARHAGGGADAIVSPLDYRAIPQITQTVVAEGTTTVTTTSSTWVDMPDMTVTLTTGNSYLLVIFSVVAFNNTSGYRVYLRISIDGTGYRGAYVTSAGGVATQAVLAAVTAGQHTVSGQWRIDGGVGYNQAGTYDYFHRRLIVIEFKK